MLNNVDVNITTFEDPVEVKLHGLNQSQVRTDIGYTFASGLRAALRQDPDIIMV
jgi:type II secretory ATPase GspE/PulE/Tfp pilus assembly ATPase PilB-like protein